MRDKIWYNVLNVKWKVFRLEEIIVLLNKRERWTNIILAIASSGSIATWALWNKFPVIWATIIAVSHVVSTLKPFFTYSKHHKSLIEVQVKLSFIQLDFENLWFEIQNEFIEETKVQERSNELEKELIMALDKLPSEIDYKSFKKSGEVADERMALYEKVTFQIS